MFVEIVLPSFLDLLLLMKLPCYLTMLCQSCRMETDCDITCLLIYIFESSKKIIATKYKQLIVTKEEKQKLETNRTEWNTLPQI